MLFLQINIINFEIQYENSLTNHLSRLNNNYYPVVNTGQWAWLSLRVNNLITPIFTKNTD